MLSELRLKGQERLHFKSERDSRRREICSALVKLEVRVHVYNAATLTPKQGRPRCLEMLVADLAELQASRLVLEQDAAARDLWDLWALTNIGAINPHTAALFRKHGPTGKNPGTHVFTRPPSDNEWHTQLAGQTRLTITATDALHTVRTAWNHLTPHP